jgi:transposase
MYLRVTRRRNRDGSVAEYYQLAETRWDPAKRHPTAHVVHNFGRADAEQREGLLRLARSITRVCTDGVEPPAELAAPGEKIELDWARPLGTVHVVRALWEELGIGEILRDHQRRRGRRAPHELALFTMVANRLLEPLSKLAGHDDWLGARVYLPDAEALTLDQLYLALDFLDAHSEAIEREVFFRTADLFNADVDLIFWDTTSVYFEIDDEDAAEQTRRGKTLPPLRKRGHSKDRRDGDPQVVVGLALTRDGLPVRSWVFPGNTVDATTVAQVKADLRGWKLGRAIFVGDAGMDSEANRRELAKGLGHYILAMPVGKLKEVQEDVLARPGRFRVINDTLEVKEVVVGTGERRRRYLVCRNQEEAERQRHHREEILTALKAELARLDPDAAEHSKRACELVASARYGRYLTRGPGGRLTLDTQAVRAAERLDGKYVLLTNDDTLTPEDVGLGYKSMMIIEACFRRMKTTGLRIRPVYHWTAHRIVSHVKLCVLALLIERAAELRTGDTWRTLRLALDEIKAIRYQVQGTTIVQSTRLTPEAAAILNKLKISAPSRVLAVEKPAPAPSTT